MSSSAEAWGGLGERGPPRVRCTSRAQPFLGCQRCLGTFAICLLSVHLGDGAAREGDVQYQGLLFTKQVACFWRQCLDTAERGFGPCVQLCVACSSLLIRRV